MNKKKQGKIIQEDEQFYKNVCNKYIDTMLKEMLFEIDNKIVHIFIEDEYIQLKDEGKINNQNYKKYLDGNFNVYEYDSYQELYNYLVKDEIAYDLNDLELFDSNGNWDFYITFEELQRLGYGFMGKDQFPLIEKYAVPKDKIFDIMKEINKVEVRLPIKVGQVIVENILETQVNIIATKSIT